MRSTLAISLVMLLALAGGCNQKDQQTANVESSQSEVTAKALTPEELGELGAKIRKNPDRTAELLRDHGLTEKSFEVEIRKVTENPEASKRYAAAYKKSSA
ncbi:MAG TPA: hypothetical protein VGQ36_20840 [Thermoanaerobaculia bacterium]|nr:hypothetical protein [Thermoanaerobaculia bacterium]